MTSRLISMGAIALSGFAALAAAASQPNVLIILADDMDNHMGSVENMPLLNQYIISQGATRENHYCTVSLCCPSRASLWTGRHAHNHNVTDVKIPYGGYTKVVQEGVNDNFLPIWLQNAGYDTYYVGKLWNGHTAQNYDSPYVNGFTGSDFIIAPNAYNYYNTSMVRNRGKPVYHDGQYATDVVAKKANNFLKTAVQGDKPWFLVAAPVGPHAEIIHGEQGSMPPAAKRHEGLFQDFQIPRTENFNPASMNGAAYYKNLDPLTQEVIDYNDMWQRHRLRALQAIDEMVQTLVQTLSDANALENTYVIFTSDNGYHLSQHRMFAGKNCGLETDINVPFFVRGPGIESGSVDNTVGSHVDVSPTIMELIGAGQRDEFDGGVLSFGGATDSTYSEHITVEHWGRSSPEGLHGSYGNDGDARAYGNNTFRSVRLIGDNFSFYYSVFCNGEHEFYDMRNDPGQIHNLYGEPETQDAFQFQGRNFDRTAARLDTLLMVMKSCVAEECRRPWNKLFPNAQVSTLSDAMDERFDNFFANQPAVEWEECTLGYIKELEGPINANVYQGGSQSPAIKRGDEWKYELGPHLHN